MVMIQVAVLDAPKECAPYGAVRLAVQRKDGYDFGHDGVFNVSVVRQPDRKGTLQWKGDAINHHGDGRRFIYLAWLASPDTKPTMFRRIKLYLDQIADLNEGQDVAVQISGRGKDGSPACSTAIIIP